MYVRFECKLGPIFSQFEMKVVAATSPWSNYIVYQRFGICQKSIYGGSKVDICFSTIRTAEKQIKCFCKMHFSTVQFGKILVIFCFIWDR